jgi:hypothetical protein
VQSSLHNFIYHLSVAPANNLWSFFLSREVVKSNQRFILHEENSEVVVILNGCGEPGWNLKFDQIPCQEKLSAHARANVKQRNSGVFLRVL